MEQHETYRRQGLQRYSAAFCDNGDARSATPPAPRTSPEQTCPRTSSPDSSEESFIDENDNYHNDYDIINEVSQTRSVSSAGSRSLVFAIPTASNEVTGSDDEDTQSDFKPGRLSTDYVAKSEVLLDELVLITPSLARALCCVIEQDTLLSQCVSPYHSNPGQGTLCNCVVLLNKMYVYFG